MNVSDRFQELLRMRYAEIRKLPESSSVVAVDEEGRKRQIVTWCERTSEDSYRVVVSIHRTYALGTSSVESAEGFTVHSDGRVEVMGREEAMRLLL